MNPPEVSVIVPVYRAERTLERCVAALLEQSHPDYEVIISASADRPEELPSVPTHPRLRVLTHVPRLGAAAARNRGAAVSTGRWLAFTDADVMVTPDWLERLVEGAEDGSVVAGSVVNGTPESAGGTVEYLTEFLDLSPRRPPRTAWHGATCNLLVPREIWERLGPFPEDLTGGEDTILTTAAKELGRFRFAPTAAVVHLNRTRIREVVRHQYEIGRFTAHLGRRSGYKLRFLVRYPALAPVAAAGRVVSVYSRWLAWGGVPRRRAVTLLPLVSVTLGAWGLGLLREGVRISAAHRRRGATARRR